MIRLEGRLEGHELVCAQRYAQILEKIVDIRATMALGARIGVILAALLFLLELGKATLPQLFELIMKGHA